MTGNVVPILYLRPAEKVDRILEEVRPPPAHPAQPRRHRVDCGCLAVPAAAAYQRVPAHFFCGMASGCARQGPPRRV
jgi:hypothetical protein